MASLWQHPLRPRGDPWCPWPTRAASPRTASKAVSPIARNLVDAMNLPIGALPSWHIHPQRRLPKSPQLSEQRVPAGLPLPKKWDDLSLGRRRTNHDIASTWVAVKLRELVWGGEGPTTKGFTKHLIPTTHKPEMKGPLAVVGVVGCVGRSLGIAGELASCALLVFPQVSPRLVALHVHVYIYIFILQVLYLPNSLQQLDSLAWSAAIQVPARPPRGTGCCGR